MYRLYIKIRSRILSDQAEWPKPHLHFPMNLEIVNREWYIVDWKFFGKYKPTTS